jgi:lipoprotein NlpI
LKGFQAKALKTNQDLVSLDGFVPYQFFIGWLYYVRGFKNKESLDKAAAELKESVRLQPALPSSHRVLGAVYRSQGKNDLAIFELKEAIRLDPYSAKNHKELAIVYRNGVFSSDGCLDLSIVEPGIRSIKEAVRLDPNDAYSHFLLGWFFTLTGNFDLGIFEYKTATDLDNQSQYREKIAMAYLLKGDVDIALDRLLVTLEEKSSQEAIGNLLYDLSFAYLILNRFDEARVKAYSAVSNRVSKPAYAKIINYLALQQLQKKSEAQALLLAHTRQNKPGSWEYDIVQYYLGIINEEKLLGKVSNPCKKTEAYFYIGYNYLINENREKAMSCFRIACDEKIYGFSEYAGACIKLRELEQANASK